MSTKSSEGFIKGVFATLAAIVALVSIYEFFIKNQTPPQFTPPTHQVSPTTMYVVVTATALPTQAAIQPSPIPTQVPANFYFQRSTTFHQQGQYNDAIANFKTCIQLDPSFADCYNGLGMAYREIGDFTQALSNHDQAIAINPRFDFYFERGVTYHKKGVTYQQKSDYDNAIFDFKVCVNKSSSFSNCYNRLGMAYRDIGDYSQALIYHNKAIDLSPTRGDFFWERGVTYQRMGNTAQADADFNKAHELGYGK